MPVEMVERTREVPFHVVFREFLEIEYSQTSFHSTDDIIGGFRLVRISNQTMYGPQSPQRSG